jgi:uncharacterized protein
LRPLSRFATAPPQAEEHLANRILHRVRGRWLGATAARRRGHAALLVLALCLIALPALAAPKFPPLTGRVVDEAHILSASTVQQLDAELAGLERQTGRQVVVATIGDLQGYDIADYGYQLGRAWGVGRKDHNDGVVFIVAPGDRKVRIEVGYGLEPVLTDALSNVILQQKVLPRFREGRMEQGVVDGAAAIVQQLALPDDQAKANVAKAQAVRDRPRDSNLPLAPLVVIFIVVWFLLGALRGRGGGAWWLLPLLLSGGGRGDRWGRGGGWSGGGGGGGFSGGGGSFGGGGSSGSW